MRLFFYGTLGEGMDNPVIRAIRPKLRRIGPATVRGELYAIPDRDGWYPALVPADDGGEIEGSLYEATSDFTSDDLARLDGYEAFDPKDQTGSQYVRRSITVTCGGKIAEAEVYLFNAALPAGSRPIAEPSFAAFLAAYGLKPLAPRDP